MMIRNINGLFQHATFKLLQRKNLTFCEHNNLSNRGEIIDKFFANDKVHLSKDGTNVLGSNLSYTLKKAFGIQIEKRQYSPPRNRRNPNMRGKKEIEYCPKTRYGHP